jgi:hypothetical protein
LSYVQTDRPALRHAELKGAAQRSAAGLDDNPCIIAPDCATSNISEHDPESVGTSKVSVRSCAFYLDVFCQRRVRGKYCYLCSVYLLFKLLLLFIKISFELNHAQIEKLIDLYKQKLNCGIPKTTVST